MKKKLTAIFCTSLAVLMLSSLSAPVLAADYGGKVAYDQAGILRFGVEKVKPGQSYLAPDGQSVPSVITYTDPSGGKTNYLPVQLLAELVDVPVTWNAGQQSVSIGCDPRKVIVVGSDAEAFASVVLTPGQTLTRAFKADDDADVLKTTLMMIVDPYDEPIADLTITSVTYGYAIRHTSPGVTVFDSEV